jgi:hypothetical protein
VKVECKPLKTSSHPSQILTKEKTKTIHPHLEYTPYEKKAWEPMQTKTSPPLEQALELKTISVAKTKIKNPVLTLEGDLPSLSKKKMWEKMMCAFGKKKNVLEMQASL